MSDLLSFLLISFLLLFSSCWPFILLFWERASTLSSSPYIAVLFLPSSYLSFLVFSLSLVFFFYNILFLFHEGSHLKNHFSLLFSCSVMSDSFLLRGLQHTRLPCPSVSPWVCSNSRPLSWWCHPITLPSVVPFSSCLQSFPASGSFPMSWLFASGGQSSGASASASVLPMNIWGWFPLGWTGWISL